MPTSRNVTPHRILPFILAIPLLLLILSIRTGGPVAADGLSPCDGPCSLSHRLPIPIPWADDVLTTGLPTPTPIGKRTLRKPVSARLPVVDKPHAVRRKFPTGPRSALSSPLGALTESLLLSRPPPAVSPPDGNGGSKGNDGKNKQFDV